MGSVLSRAEFYELFETARHTARRLESRERYDAPEERDALQRFLAGQWTETDSRRDRPEWERIVRGLTERGGRFERVRVVPEPLTDYLRFELFGCRLNVEWGEDIRYLHQEAAARLDLPDHDFWVFDSRLLVLMRWTQDDRPLDHELVTDPELVARHERWIDLAMAHATLYVEYLAEDPTRELPRTGVA